MLARDAYPTGQFPIIKWHQTNCKQEHKVEIPEPAQNLVWDDPSITSLWTQKKKTRPRKAFVDTVIPSLLPPWLSRNRDCSREVFFLV